VDPASKDGKNAAALSLTPFSFSIGAPRRPPHHCSSASASPNASAAVPLERCFETEEALWCRREALVRPARGPPARQHASHGSPAKGAQARRAAGICPLARQRAWAQERA